MRCLNIRSFVKKVERNILDLLALFFTRKCWVPKSSHFDSNFVSRANINCATNCCIEK